MQATTPQADRARGRHGARWLAPLALLLAGAGASAHDAFFDPVQPPVAGRYLVRYADDGKPLPFVASKLTRAWGLDAAGKPLELQATPLDGVVQVVAPPTATLLALTFDNGFFSRTTQGTVNKPMNEAPGAVSAVWARKTGKYVVRWTELVTRPIGLELEIVPLSATPPRAGDTLAVQVLWEGRPVEGIKVSPGEHASGERTDTQGRANFRVAPGRNFVWTERRVRVQGDPRHDSLAVATNLVFQAP